MDNGKRLPYVFLCLARAHYARLTNDGVDAWRDKV